MTPDGTRTSAPTRYVMITKSYAPLTGGVERHVGGVHQALGNLGLSGRIVVLHRSPAPEGLSSGVEWIRFPAGLSRARIFARPAAIVALLRTLGRDRTAVLHFHDAATLHPFLPLLRAAGLLRKTYITFHGWEGKFPPEPTVIRQRQECERAAVGTMLVGEFIRRWYGAKGDVVTYGAADVKTLAQFPAVASGEPLRAAYVGRLEPDAGLPIVLDAFRRLRGMPGAPIRLSVFGSGSLESLVRKEQRGNVTLEPALGDIREVYRSFPIIFASGYLTILEALCAGRVVFACYDNPLRKEYLTLHPAASSFYVCGSAAAVADGLIDCRDAFSDVLSRCGPGWTWAREQSWERLAGEYRSLWSAHE